MKKIIIGIFILLLLAACTAAPTQTPTANPTPSPNPAIASTDLANCKPVPYVVPTLSAKIPAYTTLDKSIGLHVTGTYTVIDPVTYRLKIDGLVNHPLELTYDQIRCLPSVTERVILLCPTVFQDDAVWKGVRLSDFLQLAGVKSDATEVDLASVDGYVITVTLDQAKADGAFLAYEVNGQILPIIHGFPLRAVFKDQPGNQWVKWVVGITVK
jgi:DMSO/TMAO reductase YedYZ molybdopterin-dependent catalytic subunit